MSCTVHSPSSGWPLIPRERQAANFSATSPEGGGASASKAPEPARYKGYGSFWGYLRNEGARALTFYIQTPPNSDLSLNARGLPCALAVFPAAHEPSVFGGLLL